ncbi:DinB family protein [Sediminibacillus terrae]|uniref:DinB family protein n=1 Tax=Sediminibacillus terrae TaxID=1562106 RepID=UPI00040D052D|nr:DinB family protein [Sediminibacillus terrae]
MHIKTLLTDQFNACYGKDTWFVSIKTAINGVNTEEALWKNKETMHSIWEIVNHLIYYNALYLKKFKGESGGEAVLDNDATFTVSVKPGWEETTHVLDQLMAEWIENIEASSDAHMEKWVTELNFLALHHTYHVGQIVNIRKSIGTWDSASGVLG